MPEDTKAVVPIAPEAVEATQEKPRDPDSGRFVELARQQKALRNQAKQLQAEKAAFAEERAKAPQQDPNAWKTRLKNDPMSVFTEAGLTQDELSNLILNSQPQDIEIRRLRTELEAIKSGQNETVNKIEASQKQAYEQAVKQLTREVTILVDSDEAYETVKATNSQDAIVALIESTYKDDGILLSAEEAANQVEEYLLEEAVNLSKLKKVQSKLAPPAAVEEQAQKITTKQTQPTQTTTLTHQAMASSTSAMSSKERRQRAILAFQGQLK